MPTVAQLIVKYLKAEGTTTVFGYPGAAVLPLYDALSKSGIKNILVRGEQSAGHAASGYARVSGKAGVCIATSGPGATNLITAIATAYMDSVPIIAITGQVRSELIGRDVFQEADITGACEPFVKHSYLVKNAEDIPRIFKEAFNISLTGRPGPVLIDIPVDILKTELHTSAYPKSVDILGYKPCVNGHIVQIKRAAAAVNKSRRPVICAGGGVFIAKAQARLRSLAEKTGIPVINTLMGTGAIPKNHPLNLGMFGTHGKSEASYALYNSDLLVVCGARLGDRAVAQANQLSENAQVIHIDIDPAEIGKNIKTEIPIVGDLDNVLDRLYALVNETDRRQWIDECRAAKNTDLTHCEPGSINPVSLIRRFTSEIDKKCVICADVGANQLWTVNGFSAPDGRLLTSGGMGTMGYSIPAAIGAKLSDSELFCAAICGDGAFQMSMNELATIVQNDLGVKIIIMNNHSLGLINELQDADCGKRHTSTDLGCTPDYRKIAAAYGIRSFLLERPEDTEKALFMLLRDDKPFILEVAVDASCTSRCKEENAQ